MAVAVQPAEAARMGPNEDRSVHPFFSLTRDKSKWLKAPTSVAGTPLSTLSNPSGNPRLIQDPSIPPQPSEPEEEQQEDVEPIAAISRVSHGGTDPTDETKKPMSKRAPRGSRNPSSAGKEHTKVIAQKELMDKTFRSTSGTQVHQHLNDAPQHNSDLDGGRRKRCRTDSIDAASLIDGSTALGTWDQQLKAAALDSKDSMLAGPPRDGLGRSGTPNLSLPPGPETSLPSVKNEERLAEDLQLIGEAVDPNNKPAPLPEAGTPPKKILKLRKDGRLRSPKFDAGAGAQKNKVGRPRKNQGRGTSAAKIAIMKYGKDAESRATTGQSIERIFAGPPTITNKSPKKIPQGPPKPTHPFFSGKLGAPIDLNTSSEAKRRRSSIDLQSVRSGTTSPQKKSIAIAPEAVKAWAALGALGRNTMSTDFARILKFPGAREPLWPPRNMQHCRGISSKNDVSSLALGERKTATSCKKLKGSEVQVHPNEDVLYPLREYYRAHELTSKGQNIRERKMKILRLPERRLMTGKELQEALRPRVAAKLPSYASSDTPDPTNPSSNDITTTVSTHGALPHVFQGISTSFSAFDKFQCETRDWVQKYSPCCAAHVLQQGKEAVLLRDWLKSLTVMSVDTGNASKAKGSTPLKKRKKKRKRAEELDGFIISSEDEANEMDELTDPETTSSGNEDLFGPKRSMISIRRNSNPTNSLPKFSNAVVISGPHGCGKTATVYAVAQELGFEVFEINPGSRRSGRDLLDRVGDVARNHLVHQGADTDNTLDLDEQRSAALQEDIDSGRQKTMQSFLKPKGKGKPASKARAEPKADALKPKNQEKKPKNQKQSLILLEEVDILFEEDKQFWATVLGLISQSKRPVIMTCTDESRLPLNTMALHAIFRLTPPPEQLAVDYLILIAGNEGHLLSRDALTQLYKRKNFDLRASVTELNFWCQMAVGDMKGGLEWMLTRSNAEECHNDQGQPLRVVSDGTYCAGMGFSCRDQAYDGLENDISDEMQLMSEEMHNWDYEEDLCELLDPGIVLAASKELSAHRSFDLLKVYDMSFDALSVADVLPCIGLRRGNNVRYIPWAPCMSSLTHIGSTRCY